MYCLASIAVHGRIEILLLSLQPDGRSLNITEVSLVLAFAQGYSAPGNWATGGDVTL